MARARRSVAPREVALRWIELDGEQFALFEWPINTSEPAADRLDPLVNVGPGRADARPANGHATSEQGTVPRRPPDGHPTSRRPRTANGAPPPSARDLSLLSSAERAVLAYVTRGDSNAEIALARKTSERTVANQVAKLLRKLGASSRFDLIRWFGRG